MFIDVDRLPGAPALHVWTDWAELLTLTSPGNSLSIPQLEEFAERRKQFIASEGLDNQDPKETEEESLIEQSSGDPSEFRDALSKRAGDVLSYMIDRSDRYGAAYPFEVDEGRRVVALRKLTDARRLYLFLLTCAALRYVSPSDRSVLTSKFELLCVEFLRQVFPPTSEVHLFGKNALSTGRYEGPLLSKIQKLADDLGERSLAKALDFEKGDSGDNGLDVVAWIPLSDSLPGRVLVFGQAACTTEWISKQHSSSAPAWRGMIPFTVDPQNMVFIPFDYRRPGGEWYTQRHIQQSIVIDRHRLLRAMVSGGDFDDRLPLQPDLLRMLDLESVDEAIQESMSV